MYIYPFPNGNGRHARLMSDLFLVNRNMPRFTWGKGNLQNIKDLRKEYITALKEADNYNFLPLLKFSKNNALNE
jgi:Fic family protein